jgi:hypothetical protein
MRMLDTSKAALMQAAGKDSNAGREQLLRDYAQLSGNVMQLAAYMLAEDTQMPSSFGSMADENHDNSNQRASVLLSPRAAALALKCGSVGALSLSKEQHCIACAMLAKQTVIRQ